MSQKQLNTDQLHTFEARDKMSLTSSKMAKDQPYTCCSVYFVNAAAIISSEQKQTRWERPEEAKVATIHLLISR